MHRRRQGGRWRGRRWRRSSRWWTCGCARWCTWAWWPFYGFISFDVVCIWIFFNCTNAMSEHYIYFQAVHLEPALSADGTQVHTVSLYLVSVGSGLVWLVWMLRCPGPCCRRWWPTCLWCSTISTSIASSYPVSSTKCLLLYLIFHDADKIEAKAWTRWIENSQQGYHQQGYHQQVPQKTKKTPNYIGLHLSTRAYF